MLFFLALTFLQSAEPPKVIHVRLEVLIEEKCEDIASNICSWCIRCPTLQNDVFIRKTHLLLLFTLHKEDMFRTAVISLFAIFL